MRRLGAPRGEGGVPPISEEAAARIMDNLDEVISGIDFTDVIIGPKPKRPPLEIEVVRELTLEDLPALARPQGLGQVKVGRVRHTHHMLAKLVVKGADWGEISAVTGYAPAWARQLTKSAEVQELIATYSARKDDIFVDVMERMKVLGLSTIDEVQHRLERKPEDFTNRELLELAELLLVKSQLVGKAVGAYDGRGASGNNVAVNVKFVSSPPKQQGTEISLDAIELEYEEVKG